MVELTVNGLRRRLDVDPERTLLSVLREDLDLTGTKYGCGEGLCGACTVLLEGEPTRSCQVLVKQAQGKRIVTIEGLAAEGHLHPVQQAFMDHDAMQCGYCTPGMILASVALLNKNHSPTPAQVSDALEGHVCRCGCYQAIIAAVQQAAQRMRGGAR